MTVCQFFLRGQCKFGDQCRNEHPQDGKQKSGFGNQTWTNQNVNQTSSALAPAAFTAESISKDLTPNVDKPLWPLTSFAPSKYSPTVITGLDESPEELRVRASQAIKNGNVSEYTQYESSRIAAADQIFANARSNPAATFEQAQKVVNPPTASAFGGTSFGANTGTSAFGSTTNSSSAFGQSTAPAASAFGQSSAFGSNSTSAFGKSAFGAPSAFGQSAFGQSTQPAASSGFGVSAFGQSASGAPSAFGQPATGSTSAFGQSAFGQPAAGATSAFGQPTAGTASAFGQTTTGAASAFGQSPSVTSAFGQASFGQSGTTQPAFGQSAQSSSAFGTPQPGGSAFGQTTQPAPATSAFGQSAQPPQPSSAFGQPAQPSAFGQTAFGQSTQPTSAFGQSAFGTTTKPASAFGQSAIQPGTGAFGGSSNGGAFSAFTSQPKAFGSGNTSSAFGQPAPGFTNISSPFAPNEPASNAFGTVGGSAASQTSAFKTASATSSVIAAKDAGIFASARVSTKPGADKHDVILPPNYLQMLPKAAKEAFEAASFTWNNVPEWIPPIELR